MNQNNDDQYGQEDYGQDHYDDQQPYEAEGDYADEGYDDSQLPVQENRTFFQRFANLIIFGGVGIFLVVMGYLNFGHLLFPKPTDDIAPVTSDQLLNPAAPMAAVNPDAPVIPPEGDPAAFPPPAPPTPVLNPMGEMPQQDGAAAPAADGGIALSPAAPTNPEDPWAEVAAAPPVTPPVVEPEVAAPEPVAPSSRPQPMAQDGGMGVPEVVSPAEAEKLLEAQKKLAEAEAVRAEQEAAITDLQNRLAEAEAKAAAAPARTEAEPAPKPKKVAKPKPAPKPLVAWELRSAEDGAAWIARRSDNQLYRVTVGETVPGLGRITAIREQGGQWVVVGTAGMLRQ